jgi:(R)-2-hydroxyacyl-CoA dehydratese activating ATPase
MIAAGIDIGSRSIGFVLMDADGAVIHQELMDSGYDPIGRAKSHVAAFDYDLIVATGYGRHAANAQFAGQVITEIKAYARGARLVHPGVRSILDIGGQDTKAILLDEKGAVEEFYMNEKCAAGTGKFLEVMAVALGYTLEEFVESPFGATGDPIKISSMCTVFAESEVVSLLHRGAERANVARAVHDSIAERAAGMLKRTGVIQPAMFAGGGAKNRFLRKALEERLTIEFIVPQEPQLIGAIGAAWEATRLLKKK